LGIGDWGLGVGGWGVGGVGGWWGGVGGVGRGPPPHTPKPPIPNPQSPILYSSKKIFLFKINKIIIILNIYQFKNKYIYIKNDYPS